MAVMRTPPKCPECGGTIHGVYKDYGDTPKILIPIGDSFLYWDWDGHKCKKKKKKKVK